MKLITVRHGKTVANQEGLTQGWLDNHLTQLNKEGIEQAKKVAERLKGEKIDVIYSSDLGRAKDTAKEIAKYHDCKLVLDKRLREIKKGIYEGGPGEKHWADFEKYGLNIKEWKPEGGENEEEFKERIIDFIKEIEEKHKNQTVLVVSHGGTLAVVSRHFHNDWHFQFGLKQGEKMKHHHDNTAISEYTFDGKEWKETKFNCTKHLE
ncbi:MAG: histidine phosphatase family protein [archaeon]|nr:histidine phosphatase family protein [archaeon]MCR4323419.1 histidine phosphatase family protein [Nanoarchaeota archaeon]